MSTIHLMHQIHFSKGVNTMSKKQLIKAINEDIDDLSDVELEIELMERFK